MSAREALEAFSHIELTEEERDEALLWRKQKKAKELEQAILDKRAEENRRALTQSRWSTEQTNAFMQYRADQIFNGAFSLDSFNSPVFELMVCYFSEDKRFESLAASMGIPAPSLQKGLLLAGNFGVGKTWLMKLFSKNQRQCFKVISAKTIADDFEKYGEEGMSEYVTLYQNAVNDVDAFFQRNSGLCMDDLGTEDLKIHFGNKKNVVGDIIEKRYNYKSTGVFLHATTNLTADQLKEFYGGRVTSRMREVFNFIELPGQDRRK